MRRGVEETIRRERTLVVLGLAALAGLSWAYLLHLHRDAAEMSITMPQPGPWDPETFALSLAMWAVMMVAMMTPAALPMLLVLVTVTRDRPGDHPVMVRAGLCLLGYLLVWLAGSLLAALGQWGFRALRSSALVSPWLGGLLLVTAGLYQFTPLKDACLSRCRSPLGFLLTEWRDGRLGALVMGLRHGSFCVGCCWMLMALLFAAGAMNLLWAATIAAFVLAEKTVPAGVAVSRLAGVLLVGWGAWVWVLAGKG